MKIIEAISDTNIGGAGVLLVNRLKHTDTAKYRTRVLLPKGSKLVPRILDTGVECIELDIAGDRSMDPCAIPEFLRAIKEYKPDIINSHGCMSSRIAATMCGVPINICTRHCVFPISSKYKLLKWFFAPVNSCLSDVFIAVADAAKQNLISLGIKDKKIKVIINGAEPLKKLDQMQKDHLLKELNIPQGSTVLGFCARLEECKGHDWFLKALSELDRRGANCVALFIGDGSQKTALIEKSRELGVEKMVRFIGFVNDVSPYMNISHININCSVGTETSSLALSEGMSIGLPAVVSDYGGNPYMVHDGLNGFVCSCYDYVRMADCIQTLINDKNLYKRMSEEAYRRYYREFNARSMTEKTNKLYDELYSAHRTANK